MSASARRFVQTLTGRRQSDVPGSSTKLVYGHHELDEIAVVSSNATPQQVKYGSGPLSTTANGPRIVPGIVTKPAGGRMIGDRLSSSGTRLDSSSPAVFASSGNKSSSESLRPNKLLRSVSRQNLLGIVRCGGSRQKPHQRSLFTASRDSLAAACKNRSTAASELDLTKSKVRRKEYRGNRLKLPAPIGDTKAVNGTVSHQHGYQGSKSSTTNWSFVFDPAGRLCYYWSMVVSLAFLYNFWVIIYRFAFQEINRDSILVWFCLDYLADFLYIIDILFHFRTGYLEDGVLQTDAKKLRTYYMNSTTFYIDCLCLLPLDFLYLSIGFNSILRSFRLVKIYRFWAFMDRTERHTNYPNLFRSTSLIHYLLVIFHWNGCLYHIICKNNGFGSRNWVYSDNDTADVVKQYLQSYYWCTLALTTIGDLPRPRSKGEYLFVIVQLLFGLLLFATVLGHVANIVTSVSAARKEFQDESTRSKLDGVKTYMRMRRVPNHLQVKVIKWFDYLWLTQKCSDEERAVSCLPDKLKAEIAINVHLDTLKRVEIFQNTEAGFLCELVLRLRPVLFSPGDYICRKGEVGKEMYIVNRGRLQVVADNGKTVLATLKAGSYFGEISILNMGTAGNRRTASVRSVGYSDLFVLSKKDLWDVLKEYPAARVRLEAIAVKRLDKYKKAPLEKAAMSRSLSTPGLMETKGRVPLEEMALPSGEPLLKGVLTPHYANLGFSPAPSPTCRSNHGATAATTESPLSVASSIRSSDQIQLPATKSLLPAKSSFVSDFVPQTESQTVIQSQTESQNQLQISSQEDPLRQEDFIAEIKRLRERLVTLETENTSLNEKLKQQQWEVEHRLAEIEMHICGASSADSSGEENNRESII